MYTNLHPNLVGPIAPSAGTANISALSLRPQNPCTCAVPTTPKKAGSSGLAGLGFLEELTQGLSTTDMLLIGGAAFAAWWFWSGFSGKRQEVRRLEAEFAKRRAEIDEKYSTGGRVRRARKKATSIIPKVSWS